MLYHHVIRRRVSVELEASFDDPLSAPYRPALAREAVGSGSLFVNDQFVTLVRRPARGKAGLAEKAAQDAGAARDASESRPIPRTCARLRAAAQALAASLGDYGAQPLGDYVGPSGRDQQRSARTA